MASAKYELDTNMLQPLKADGWGWRESDPHLSPPIDVGCKCCSSTLDMITCIPSIIMRPGRLALQGRVASDWLDLYLEPLN